MWGTSEQLELLKTATESARTTKSTIKNEIVGFGGYAFSLSVRVLDKQNNTKQEGKHLALTDTT